MTWTIIAVMPQIAINGQVNGMERNILEEGLPPKPLLIVADQQKPIQKQPNTIESIVNVLPVDMNGLLLEPKSLED